MPPPDSETQTQAHLFTRTARISAFWPCVWLGVILFALFGAIAGGLFIQLMDPVLLVMGGLWLFWLRPEAIFPEDILKRFHLASRPGQAEPAVDPFPIAQEGVKSPPAAQPQRGLVEPLSARELEVLRLIEQGLSNAEIADRLTLAPSTVKTHINNIYGKLGAQNRVQAIRQAKEQGLLGG